MNEQNQSVAVVSAAVLHADRDQRRLLQSIVEVARAIFEARASSVFLLDAATGSLVFEAVAGAGEEFLVGRSFPADVGVAGWVLASGEPMTIDDLSTDKHFARGLAASTGYLPQTMLAAPLLHDDRPIGVIEVLDRRADPGRVLDDLDLLGLFANQAAIALDLVRRSRAAHQVLTGEGHYDELVSVVSALDRFADRGCTSGRRLLVALNELLTQATTGG